MNVIWPYVALLLAAGLLWSARKGNPGLIGGIAWAVVAVGFAFLQWADATLGAAAGIAACAGFAAVPVTSSATARRLRVAAFACVVPLALAGVAITCIGNVGAPTWSGNLVLFVAGWSALVAASTCAVAAIGVSRRPLSMSVGAALICSAAGVLVAGTGRSSLADAFYGLSLRTGESLLQWVLGPVPGFEGGIRLSVAVPAPQIQWVLSVIAGLGLVAIVTAYTRRHGASSFVLGAAALASFGLLVALPAVVSSLSMPASEPYVSEIKRRILARGGERVVDSGAFTSTADISIAMSDLGPEVFGLLFAGLLALVAAVALRKDADEPTDGAIDRAFSRDLLVRSVAFLWASWFVFLVIHHSLLGSPGMGSPGEWVYTGVCIVASGLVMAFWTPPTTRFGAAFSELVPGLIVGALLLAAGLAWRFGALLGLSLGILG